MATNQLEKMAMQNNNFRPARAIELYDTGMVIRLGDACGLDGYTYRHSQKYVISAGVLRDLAKFFELPYDLRRLPDGIEIERQSAFLGEEDNVITVETIDVRIDDLGLLNFRLLEVWNLGTENEKKYVREFTYHGAFNVEWERNDGN